MMNPKTHEIYSDKLCISVLNLKHIGMATEEDKRQELDKRAAAFLAKTWEEFQMLAAENCVYESVADAIYEALAEDNIREACLRYKEQKAVEERFIRERDDALKIIQEKDITIQEKDKRIAELEKALAEAGR